MSGRTISSFFKPSSALCTTWVSHWLRSKCTRILSANISSSSMMRMELAIVSNRFEDQTNQGAFAFSAMQDNCATETLHDALHQRHAETESIALGGIVGLKHQIQFSRRHAGSGIGDNQPHAL